MAMDVGEPLDATAAADKGEAALQLLREADPALFLSPSADLAAAARAASQRIYSSLAPLSPAQPPPLPTLLVDHAFDAEQIWSQIELLARPLLPHLRRQLRRLERQPQTQPQAALPVETPADDEEEQSEEDGQGSELEELKGDVEETYDEEELDDDEEAEEEEEELDGRGGKGFEDRFLKIDEMAEFLDKGDEEEYGGSSNRGEKKKARENWMEESDDEGEDDYEGEDDEGEDDDDEDQLDVRISFSFPLSLSCSKMIIIFGSFRERKLNGTSGLFLRN
jgi:U3 small nucleolar RNA-associated protein MPP10